jgi:hypothetical protein
LVRWMAYGDGDIEIAVKRFDGIRALEVHDRVKRLREFVEVERVIVKPLEPTSPPTTRPAEATIPAAPRRTP